MLVDMRRKRLVAVRTIPIDCNMFPNLFIIFYHPCVEGEPWEPETITVMLPPVQPVEADSDEPDAEHEIGEEMAK